MPKVNKIINSFNAGELSPKMDARLDQEKYAFGCRTMENFVPLIYGGADRRPGTEFIAGQKSNSAKGRVVGFEHSVDDTYILLFENQVIRVFKDGTQVLDGVGTEDISGLDNIIAHWLLNDTETTTVLDDDGNTHDGTASVDTGTLAVTGKVNGGFDLDGQYDVEISDSNDFSFTDNSNDTAFSIACWGFIEKQKGLQILLSKWRDAATTQEWRLSVDADRKLQLHLTDSSSNLEGDRVSQWKLNEDAGDTSVVDAVGLQNGVSTANTSVLAATGQISGAFDLDGQYAVEINDNAAYSFGDGSDDSAFSIAAWVFVTDAGVEQIILSKYDVTLAKEWRFYLRSDRYAIFRIYDDSSGGYWHVRNTQLLSVGWHFIVAVYKGDEAQTGINIHIDNSLGTQARGGVAGYDAMENTATKVVIGAQYDNGSLEKYFEDKLDNIVIFNKELSVADISVLWNDSNGIETTVAAEISAVSDSALVEGWHLFTSTYSAPADESTAAAGIILYVDGAAVSSTNTENASYTAMQNGAE